MISVWFLILCVIILDLGGIKEYEMEYRRIIGQGEDYTHLAAVERAVSDMVRESEHAEIASQYNYDIESVTVVLKNGVPDWYTAVTIGKFPIKGESYEGC